MYQVYKYKNDDSDEIIIINEYDDLFEAYESIDTNCKTYSFIEYYISQFNKNIIINDVTTDYYNKVIKIMDQIKEFNNYNMQDVFVLFTSLMDEDKDIPYFFINNDKYLVDLNNIIDDELNLKTFIRKNPNIIVDTLIEYNLYDHFNWHRKNNIKVENELQYNKLYKSSDVYNSIKYDTLYSSNEYAVLQDYITDLDHIIEVFIDNIYILKDLQISRDLASIVRYL